MAESASTGAKAHELSKQLKTGLDALKRDVAASMRICSRDFGVLGAELVAALARGQQRERASVDALAHERAARGKLETRLAELQGNIRVLCRVRPMLAAPGSSEDDENTSPDRRHKRVQVESAQEVSVFSPVDGALYKSFSFSRVFHEQHSQQAVFKEVAPLVLSAVAGHHACVFAYGQTGAGKTHTMQGGEGDRGLYFRVAELLYSTVAQQQHVYDFAVSVQMVEIYNEEIYDLLGQTNSSSGTGAPTPSTAPSNTDHMSPPGSMGSLGSVMGCHVGATSMCGNLPASATSTAAIGEIRHGENGVYLKNVGSVTASSAKEFHEAIARGQASQLTTKTDRSNRSHNVLLVDIRRTSKANSETDSGRLALVDLAGSERLSKTMETSTLTVREAQHINKSLAAVGDVLAALLAKEKHIPFRNSKLTHLLQDSLGGTANRTLVLVHVSPTSVDVNETINSLKFASRVSHIQMGKSQRTERTEISRLNVVIANQVVQLQTLQEKLTAELELRKKYEKRLEEYRQEEHRRKVKEDEAKKLAQLSKTPSPPEQPPPVSARRWSLYSRKDTAVNNSRGLNGIENVAENILRSNDSSSSAPICPEGSTTGSEKPSGISPPTQYPRRLSAAVDGKSNGPPRSRQSAKRKRAIAAEVRSILKKQRGNDNSVSDAADPIDGTAEGLVPSKQVSFDLPQATGGSEDLPPRQPNGSRVPAGAVRVLAPTRPVLATSPARRVVSTPSKRSKPKWNGGWR